MAGVCEIHVNGFGLFVMISVRRPHRYRTRDRVTTTRGLRDQEERPGR